MSGQNRKKVSCHNIIVLRQTFSEKIQNSQILSLKRMNPLFEDGESSGWRRWTICLKKMNHLDGKYSGFTDPVVGAHQKCFVAFLNVFETSMWSCVWKRVEFVSNIKHKNPRNALAERAWVKSKVLELNCNINSKNHWYWDLKCLWKQEGAGLYPIRLRVLFLCLWLCWILFKHLRMSSQTIFGEKTDSFNHVPQFL